MKRAWPDSNGRPADSKGTDPVLEALDYNNAIDPNPQNCATGVQNVKIIPLRLSLPKECQNVGSRPIG